MPSQTLALSVTHDVPPAVDLSSRTLAISVTHSDPAPVSGSRTLALSVTHDVGGLVTPDPVDPTPDPVDPTPNPDPTPELADGIYYMSENGLVPCEAGVMTSGGLVSVDGGPLKQAVGDTQLVRLASTSWLYDDLTNAPVATDSAALVARLTADVDNNWGGKAALNWNNYNSSVYVVDGASTPRVDMVFTDCQNKGWLDPAFAAALQQVPIPAGAKPAGGADANLTIYDTATDTLWEFWKAVESPTTGWGACWGGKITGCATSDGTFPGQTGSTATGLTQTGLVVSVAEAQAGVIDHALGLVVISAHTSHSWPAVRDDGNLSDADAMPEGRRLRLKASYDVDGSSLHPLAKAIARAVKKHGFVVMDKGGAVAVATESGQRWVDAGKANPWDAIFAGTAGYDILAGFPWSELEVMPHDYGKPA